MKIETSTALAILATLASATPLRRSLPSNYRREVPQEHSHNFVLDITREFLNLDNPKGILDPVFGLLGNAAAAAGAGSVTNLDCLKQETADQAFTNAKAVGDLRGMAGALMFQAVERNTAGVGVKSVICNEAPVNPEIAAFTQHQDPASEGAAEENRAITLELARQVAAIGADPLLALETGTFAPGDLGDATGKGNSCDTDPDDPGCIFNLRTLVLDTTPEEILSAVADVTPTFTGTGGISATHVDFNGLSVAAATGPAVTEPVKDAGEDDDDNNNNNSNNNSNVVVTSTVGPTEPTDAAASCDTVQQPTPEPAASCTVVTTTIVPGTPGETAGAAEPPTGTNVQAFTGTLGGPVPPVVSSAGADRPFNVEGTTFLNAGAALQRSCAIQHNACASAANNGEIDGGVAACDAQQDECIAANNTRRRRRMLKLRELEARRAAAASLARRQEAARFGTCSDPVIVFSDDLPDRQGSGFIANNLADFNHGSALNIGVIAGFVCQRLGDSCGASGEVVASCTSASAAAVATPQNQAAADAFNAGLGIRGGARLVTAATAATATAAEAPVVTTITRCR